MYDKVLRNTLGQGLILYKYGTTDFNTLWEEFIQDFDRSAPSPAPVIGGWIFLEDMIHNPTGVFLWRHARWNIISLYLVLLPAWSLRLVLWIDC